MADLSGKIKVAWKGPFSWPGYEEENRLPPIPGIPGLYLMTFEYMNGYLIHVAGLTRRPVPSRFNEHTKEYMNGKYNVLDLASAEKGIRKEIWHGWGYAREHREEFEEQKELIIEAVRKELSGLRIFVGDIGTAPRLLERLEASIMNHLGKQPSPFCDIPDTGMQLAPRWKNEEPLVIENITEVKLHGLPKYLEI